MSILGKLLVVVIAGAILLQLDAVLMGAPVPSLVWMAILLLPPVLALFDRGGTVVYVVALCVSWLLAGRMIAAMPFEICIDYFTRSRWWKIATGRLPDGILWCYCPTPPVTAKSIQRGNVFRRA